MSDSCPWPSHPPPVAVPLTVLPDRPCPYLPGRVETIRGFACARVPGEVYHTFMDRAFRRSGRLFYQPVCRGCRACQPIRVPTAHFQASKSQRRVWRRNGDVTVTVTPRPRPSSEKFELYARYQQARHDRDQKDGDGDDDAAAGFADFLYRSAVDTVEFAYRDGAGRLIGVGIGDLCAASLSSVYFYFEPARAENRRSLGIFSAMWEIAFAAQRNVPYYYLGYWVRDCAAMKYKASFRPHELLGPDGVWRPPPPPADDAGETGKSSDHPDVIWPTRAVEMP
jgi:arginyl-tRNA--protein-N-Asp/Glu arginylyltransferase